MSVTDDLVTEITNTEGVMASAVVAFQGIEALYTEATAQLAADGVDVGKITAITAELHDKTQALADAVAAVPQPAPAPEPPAPAPSPSVAAKRQ